MDRDRLQVTADKESFDAVNGARRAGVTAASRRLARHAWFVRAVAVTFLAGGAFISYLFFSTV